MGMLEVALALVHGRMGCGNVEAVSTGRRLSLSVNNWTEIVSFSNQLDEGCLFQQSTG